MKRFCVIGNAARHEQWLADLFRHLPKNPRMSDAGIIDGDFDGVVVIDDGTVDSLSAIQKALNARSLSPRLRIAVVATIDPDQHEVESLARIQRIPGLGVTDRFTTSVKRLGNLMRSLDAPINVAIDDAAVTFEYCGE